jgi:hypothetical protein
MMQRGGQVVIHLLANVQQKTIEPFIKDKVSKNAIFGPNSLPVIWTS